MIRFHQDVGIFRQAVSITQLRTGFAERLIEKDYFCSVLLEYLAAVEEALVFKGGTCLAKVCLTNLRDAQRPRVTEPRFFGLQQDSIETVAPRISQPCVLDPDLFLRK